MKLEIPLEYHKPLYTFDKTKANPLLLKKEIVKSFSVFLLFLSFLGEPADKC